MTPERWRQLTAIFHGVRELDPSRRPAALDEMCGGDASLRGEVEALLAEHDAASRSDGTAVVADFMPQLAPGTSFGPYRVEALVGTGGMGQVYRATDPRLRRSVAIKILPSDLASDVDFAARFEQEARVLASLSHPNIAVVHGLEEADGVRGIVLEFIDGPTLAGRLAHGGLPMGEALNIARQVALALEAAHEKGIIHRDLKPANIKITSSGVVKVLDFGIAKMVEPASSGATRTGFVLGTPAYMSPEQARGKVVDRRTDIWAFGCVLYEMLTGRGAFTAETASDSLVNVIEREPDWRLLPSGVPESIRRLLERCLRKDPAERLRDIGDARIEITDTASAPPKEKEAPKPLRWTRWLPIAIGLAAIVLLLIGSWLSGRGLWSPAAVAPRQYMEFGVTLPSNIVPSQGVAMSPDGQHVAVGAFSNAPEIWVHSFQQSETRALDGAAGIFPFWSPDSRTVAFFAGGRLVTMLAAGGKATIVADVPGQPSSGTWSRNGVILLTARGKVYRLPATGGVPVEVPLPGVTDAFNVQFLPDGDHFILFVSRRNAGSIHMASLASGRVHELVASDCAGVFAPPDRLLFVRDTSLVAQRLDMERFVLAGEADVIASGVSRGSAGTLSAMMISASDNGVLALPAPRGGTRGQLTWFTPDGRAGESIASPPGDTEYLNPAISPDNAFVAANRIDSRTGNWDIWVLDVTRRTASKLTTEAAADTDPVWSPDSHEIAYLSDREGGLGLYRQPIAGGPAERLLDVSTGQFVVPTDWSTNGFLLFHQILNRAWTIWALRLADRQVIPVIDSSTPSYGGRLSPDGRWLAYSAAESTEFEVFVQPFLKDAPRKQISHGGGVHPRWIRGGKELVYWDWAVPGGISSNPISVSESGIAVGPTRSIVDRPVLSLIDARTHYDITRDGERLLVHQPAGPQGPGVRVIVNWTSKISTLR